MGGFKNGILRVWDLRKSSEILNELKFNESIKDLRMDSFKCIFTMDKSIFVYNYLKNELENEIKFNDNTGYSLDYYKNNLITILSTNNFLLLEQWFLKFFIWNKNNLLNNF